MDYKWTKEPSRNEVVSSQLTTATTQVAHALSNIDSTMISIKTSLTVIAFVKPDAEVSTSSLHSKIHLTTFQ